MADPFRHVGAGQEFEPSAALHNATVDAVRDHRRRQLAGGPLGAGAKPPVGSVEVLVRNDTGSALDAGSVVKIAGVPVVSALDHPFYVRDHPILPAVAPAAATDAVAILSDAIRPGGLGRAVVSGIAVTLVDAGSGDYAAPAAGQTGHLARGSAGPCRVLWRDAGSGNRAAVVLVGASSPPAGLSVTKTVVTNVTWDEETCEMVKTTESWQFVNGVLAAVT